MELLQAEGKRIIPFNFLIPGQTLLQAQIELNCGLVEQIGGG
jgi:hypothetical protein